MSEAPLKAKLQIRCPPQQNAATKTLWGKKLHCPYLPWPFAEPPDFLSLDMSLSSSSLPTPAQVWGLRRLWASLCLSDPVLSLAYRSDVGILLPMLPLNLLVHHQLLLLLSLPLDKQLIVIYKHQSCIISLLPWSSDAESIKNKCKQHWL